MLIVGLTGSLGTGKSTVAAMFARRGAAVLNADKIAHALIGRGGACYVRVVRRFGKRILTPRGTIDRLRLGMIVFQSPAQRRALERIIHPQVRVALRRRMAGLKRSGKKIVVLDVPLLFESGLDRQTDVVVVVKAGRETQIRRACRQRGLSRREALKRIKAQMPLKDKIRQADIIIDNDKTKRETEKQVKRIWQKLLLKTKG